ncbi:MAG TPA: class I SAM-dependent methyltransferase [Candidatus Saccharimonadales bacterium]|nr:class I SAM-dependent methyltransferase [Candidatus Saccharimonadales bacterium]
MKDSPRDYASGRRRPGFLRLGFRMRSRMVLRHLRDGARVLDVGAADGAMVEELSRHLRFPLAVSVERDPELAACIPRGGVCANGLALPFPDATFDFAVCCATRKHVRDSGALMREIARVLRPGGTVVVVDPHPWVLRLGRRLGKFDPR